jgi:hypothetical protein
MTAYTGVRRLRMVASSETYVSIDTLVTGTATRAQWMVFIGIPVAFGSFWLIFVGIGLLSMPGTKVLSVLFLVVPSLWYCGVLKTLQGDIVAARTKAARAASKRERSP